MKSMKVMKIKPEAIFYHEKHEKHKKTAGFTMKIMKVMKINPGTPLSVAALCISPLATNASPLDHARRAAGGK